MTVYPKLFRMTIAGRGYSRDRGAVQPEFHFKVARAGDVRRIRRQLADRGVEYFQRSVRSMFGFWIPKKDIRVGFEREIHATKSDPSMTIEILAMSYKGKRHRAERLPSRVIPYAKRHR